MKSLYLPYLAHIGLLAIAYFGGGKVGLSLSSVEGIVTPVWPPTGIALAALLLGGYRLWPGIALGAFLVNLTAGAPLAAVLTISVGNTLEAVLGTYLLQRVGFRNSLERLHDVLGLVGLAVLVSTVVSATIGTTGLGLTGVIQWGAYGSTWWTWWLGDALGALVVTPVLLTWGADFPTERPPRRLFEALILLVLLVLIGQIAFGGWLAPSLAHAPLSFTLIPFLIWAALRFGQPGATTVTLIGTGMAVWGTTHGFGPFVQETTQLSLVFLSGFMGIMAVTAMVLATSIAERRRAEKALHFIAEVSRLLASSIDYERTLTSVARLAVPHIADWCAVDVVAPDGTVQRLAVAHVDPAKVAWAHELQRRLPYDPDAPTGLAQVLRTGRPEFYPEISHKMLAAAAHGNVEILKILREIGFTSVIIVPLLVRERILGAITLVSAESKHYYTVEDLALAEDLAHRAAIAIDHATLYQIAQEEIAERKRTELALRESQDRLAGIVNSAMDAIITVDAQQNILLFNKAAEQMFRCAATSVIGQPLDQFVPERFRLLHREYVHAFGRTGVTNRVMGVLGVVRGLRADGEEFPVEASISQIEAAGQKLYTVILRDITARKQAEQALRQSEERFGQVVLSISDHIYVTEVSEEGYFVNRYLSPHVEILTGYPQEKFMADWHFWPFTLVHPDDRFREASHVARLANGQNSEIEYRLTRADGQVIWVRDSARVVAEGPSKIVYGVVSDITRRKRAEDVLRQSEERYRSLFEHSPISLWEEDFSAVKRHLDLLRVGGITNFRDYFENNPEGVVECVALVKIIDVNKATLELCQADSKGQLFAGLSRIFCPETYEVFKEELLALLEGKTEFECESLHYTLTGEKKDTNFRLSLVPGYEDTWSKVLVSIIDISQRKRAEQELHTYKEYLEELVAERTLEVTAANQQLQREIIERQRVEDELRFQKVLLECQTEAAIDGILVVSSDKKWLFLNQRFAELWRLPEEIVTARARQAAIQLALDQVVDPHQFLLKIDHLYEHPDEVSRDELALKDGRTFDRYSAPVKGAADVYYGRVWYYRDITQRRRAEATLLATLSKTEALYRIGQAVVLAKSLPDLLQVVVDNVVEAVPAHRVALITFDLNRQEVAHFIKGGPGLDQIMTVSFDELWQGLSGWVLREKQPALSTKERPDERESPDVQRRRAETNCGAIMVVPLLYQGNILGTLTAINLPEERDFVPADLDLLLAMANQAALILEHKQAEVRQAHLLQELQSVNQELNDFAYVISHDLKAPLRAISSLSNWIAIDYADQLGPAGREQLELLVSRVKRLHALIDGVLQYSRLGRKREEKVNIDLNELLAEVIELIAPPPSINITAEPNLPAVSGEKTRLQQLFQNLLSNAIKFMDKPQGEIKIGYLEKGDEWQFYVSDNGQGIEAKYFGKIFQLFQTLAPRDEFESTGVGLTLVKKIVELHEGKIWLESRPGEGTTFFFTLPK